MTLHFVIDKTIAALSGLNKNIGVAARNFAAGLLMAMTLIILVQVFFRYVLNDSLTWTEELAKILMVWSAFLVAPWAYRMGVNVSIDMFAEALPPQMRTLLRMLLNLLVLWILWVFLFVSFGFWQRGFAIVAASLPVKMAWFYSIVPLGFAAMLLVAAELVLRDLMSMIAPGRDYSIPGAGIIREGE